MKIVADDKIPGLKGVFEPFAEVLYLPGKDIGPDDVKDADALIVRTRTACNAQLLESSSVKMVATATIGTDHFDIPWLESAGIRWVNAPGCNRSEEHTSELQSRPHLVCRLLLEKKKELNSSFSDCNKTLFIPHAAKRRSVTQFVWVWKSRRS